MDFWSQDGYASANDFYNARGRIGAPMNKPTQDTARERVIAELLAHLGGLTPTERRVAELAFAAAYTEGLEDAAKVAEMGLVGIALNNEPTIGDIRTVAAAIRKLKDGQ